MKAAHTFRRRERLKGNLNFRIIKEEARPIKGASFIIKVSPNRLSFNRIGISISAKAVPKSVDRNRLKRLTRETYRLNREALKKGFDIVVKVKTIDTIPGLREVRNELMALFGKAGILA